LSDVFKSNALVTKNTTKKTKRIRREVFSSFITLTLQMYKHINTMETAF